MPKSNLRNNIIRNMIAPQAGLENNPKAKLIPLDRLVSNPFQVRQDFSSPEALAALEELAEDIRLRGILQPLVVRPAADMQSNKFEIVAGERRYRAARLIGLLEIPAVVENFGDEEAALVSLTENLQRRDLNFKEEVDFLAQLEKQRGAAGKGGDTDLSQLIHKSRTYVAKRMKLAGYPDLVDKVAGGELSINLAYEEALSREKSIPVGKPSQPLQDAPTENITGAKEPAAPVRNLNTRLVPFIRVRDALNRLGQDLDKLPGEDRTLIKQELEKLEKELSEFKSRL